MLKKVVYLFVLFVFVAVFMYAYSANAQMVTNGLVAYWSMDKSTISGTTVKDVVGKNDGVMTGAPGVVAGKVGEALQFNGDNSVDVKGTDTLNFNGKKEMTVMVWVNAGDDKDPVKGVVANPGGCCGSVVAQRDASSWALRYDGRNPGAEMEFIICPNWQGDGGFGAPKFKKGEWHFLAVVVNTNKVLMYVDGALVKEADYAGPIASAGTEIDIGKATDGGFVGSIDEVSIYSRALSANEVKQNFQAKGLATTSVSSNGKLAICWGDLKRD